jgi:hypothetical protein
VSGVLVKNGAQLTLVNPNVDTTGNTSSEENSSFFGLNAGVLAAAGGRITIAGGSVATSGRGANGVFATGKGSMVSMAGGSIRATGDAGHGAMASAGGSVLLSNVNIFTLRQRGAALATDRGGGVITAIGGTMTTAGMGSPGIYSTGTIEVRDAQIQATGAEAAVIEGSNSILVTNSSLSGARLCGVMIYQSFSGDAQGRRGTFAMEGGSLKAAAGPLFYVNNTHGTIVLKKVDAQAGSGVLIRAAAGRWGRSGSNGGSMDFTADEQSLAGDVTADAISSVSVVLQNSSSLTGAVTNASLTLDSGSRWVVTGDSALTSLSDAGAVKEQAIANIQGNNHTVTYQVGLAKNAWLEGKTYSLAGGGQLVPK